MTKVDHHWFLGTSSRADSGFPVSLTLLLSRSFVRKIFLLLSEHLALTLATEEGKKINYCFHGLRSLKIFKVSESLPREVQRRNSSTGLFHSQTSFPLQSGASEGRLSTGELLPLPSQPAIRGLNFPMVFFTHNTVIRKPSLLGGSMWIPFLSLQQCGMEPLSVYTIRCCVGKLGAKCQKLSLKHSEAVTWLDQEEEAGISREISFPMLFLT